MAAPTSSSSLSASSTSSSIKDRLALAPCIPGGEDTPSPTVSKREEDEDGNMDMRRRKEEEEEEEEKEYDQNDEEDYDHEDEDLDEDLDEEEDGLSLMSSVSYSSMTDTETPMFGCTDESDLQKQQQEELQEQPREQNTGMNADHVVRWSASMEEEASLASASITDVDLTSRYVASLLALMSALQHNHDYNNNHNSFQMDKEVEGDSACGYLLQDVKTSSSAQGQFCCCQSPPLKPTAATSVSCMIQTKSQSSREGDDGKRPPSTPLPPLTPITPPTPTSHASRRRRPRPLQPQPQPSREEQQRHLQSLMARAILSTDQPLSVRSYCLQSYTKAKKIEEHLYAPPSLPQPSQPQNDVSPAHSHSTTAMPSSEDSCLPTKLPTSPLPPLHSPPLNTNSSICPTCNLPHHHQHQPPTLTPNPSLKLNLQPILHRYTHLPLSLYLHLLHSLVQTLWKTLLAMQRLMQSWLHFLWSHAWHFAGRSTCSILSTLLPQSSRRTTSTGVGAAGGAARKGGGGGGGEGAYDKKKGSLQNDSSLGGPGGTRQGGEQEGLDSALSILHSSLLKSSAASTTLGLGASASAPAVVALDRNTLTSTHHHHQQQQQQHQKQQQPQKGRSLSSSLNSATNTGGGGFLLANMMMRPNLHHNKKTVTNNAISDQLFRRLKRKDSSASRVISYLEMSDEVLSQHAKQRVQRMMHYDVSLKPFVATVVMAAPQEEEEKQKKQKQEKKKKQQLLYKEQKEAKMRKKVKGRDDRKKQKQKQKLKRKQQQREEVCAGQKDSIGTSVQDGGVGKNIPAPQNTQVPRPQAPQPQGPNSELKLAPTKDPPAPKESPNTNTKVNVNVNVDLFAGPASEAANAAAAAAASISTPSTFDWNQNPKEDEADDAAEDSYRSSSVDEDSYHVSSGDGGSAMLSTHMQAHPSAANANTNTNINTSTNSLLTTSTTSNTSPFMCTPKSFPPSPNLRSMVMARGTQFSEDVVFFARDQLRVEGALQSTNQRTRSVAMSLRAAKRLAVFHAQDAEASGIALSCGQHCATKVGNVLYGSTRSMVPVLRNCYVYFEMSVSTPTPAMSGTTAMTGGGSLPTPVVMSSLSVGLSTLEMPPNTLVGAWKSSVGLCTTGQMLAAGHWYAPPPSEAPYCAYGNHSTVGCLVRLDDDAAFETWDGVMLTAYVSYNVDGHLVRIPPAMNPFQNVMGVGVGMEGGGAGSGMMSTGRESLVGSGSVNPNHPGASHAHPITSVNFRTTSAAFLPPPSPPQSTCLPLYVPRDEELYPTLTLHSPGTRVMCRFCAEDILATTRDAIGVPEGVVVYAVDGSVLFEEDVNVRCFSGGGGGGEDSGGVVPDAAG